MGEGGEGFSGFSISSSSSSTSAITTSDRERSDRPTGGENGEMEVRGGIPLLLSQKSTFLPLFTYEGEIKGWTEGRKVYLPAYLSLSLLDYTQCLGACIFARGSKLSLRKKTMISLT